MEQINHLPDLMLITAINEDNNDKAESVLITDETAAQEIRHIPPRRLGCGVDTNGNAVVLKMGNDRNIWSK